MKLLKVIKNPISDHLPVGCRKFLMSFNANKVQNAKELVPAEEPIAIVVGAMAHGQVYKLLNSNFNNLISIIKQFNFNNQVLMSDRKS